VNLPPQGGPPDHPRELLREAVRARLGVTRVLGAVRRERPRWPAPRAATSGSSPRASGALAPSRGRSTRWVVLPSRSAASTSTAPCLGPGARRSRPRSPAIREARSRRAPPAGGRRASANRPMGRRSPFPLARKKPRASLAAVRTSWRFFDPGSTTAAALGPRGAPPASAGGFPEVVRPRSSSQRRRLRAAVACVSPGPHPLPSSGGLAFFPLLGSTGHANVRVRPPPERRHGRAALTLRLTARRTAGPRRTSVASTAGRARFCAARVPTTRKSTRPGRPVLGLLEPRRVPQRPDGIAGPPTSRRATCNLHWAAYRTSAWPASPLPRGEATGRGMSPPTLVIRRATPRSGKSRAPPSARRRRTVGPCANVATAYPVSGRSNAAAGSPAQRSRRRPPPPSRLTNRPRSAA